MRNTGLSLLLVLIVLGTTACGSGGDDPLRTVSAGFKSDWCSGSPESDLEETISGNNAFAFDLYSQLKAEDGNLFFSPYSISTALAMIYAGARGETEQQIADTLYFSLPQDRLHCAFYTLILELASQEQDASTGEGQAFTLNTANSLWGQRGYPFLEEFLEVLADDYGAGLRVTDFATDPETARLAINDWVSEQTEEKIKDLIPRGAINYSTRLVLANAIYFYADWLYQFRALNTHESAFTLLNEEEVTVPMMSRLFQEELFYVHGEGYQAVELPYVGERAVMTIIVPDSGQFPGFENSLNKDQLDEILSNMESKKVDLEMPKFSYESRFNMKHTLSQMGMPNAFTSCADFSGMDGSRGLSITEVFHKAFVAVDEKGTEAAAATGGVVVGAAPQDIPPVRLIIDRPFIFFIREVDTGSILFMGRMLDPVQ